MASELLSSVTGGGGGGIKLAPDLTFPSSIIGVAGYTRISGIDGSSGLTPALSLSGKFVIDLLEFSSLASETMTFRLTVDTVPIWDDTFTAPATLLLLGADTASTGVSTSSSITCDNSFLLEIQTAADTNVTLEYLARPIL